MSEEAAERAPLEETQAFLSAVAALPAHRLRLAGGNLMLHVRGVGVWTLVCDGPRVGIHSNATDDEVQLALSCEEWVLWHLLSANAEIEALVAEGAAFIDGDFGIFERLRGLV